MSEYNLHYTGAQLDDAINRVVEGYVDDSKIVHFATGVINDFSAGQEMCVTDITDIITNRKFNVKGVFAYVQPDGNSWIYPENHAAGKPAVFCFVKDSERNFGVAMACGATSNSTSYLREMRMNTDIGGITSPTNTYITFSGNSFSYTAKTSMYGLVGAKQWRWIAWG